jgi:hypothetical protein
MPIEITEDERVALIDLMVGTIEHDPHCAFSGCGVFSQSSRPVPELPSDEEADGDAGPEPP